MTSRISFVVGGVELARPGKDEELTPEWAMAAIKTAHAIGQREAVRKCYDLVGRDQREYIRAAYSQHFKARVSATQSSSEAPIAAQ